MKAINRYKDILPRALANFWAWFNTCFNVPVKKDINHLKLSACIFVSAHQQNIPRGSNIPADMVLQKLVNLTLTVWCGLDSVSHDNQCPARPDPLHLPWQMHKRQPS